MSCGPGKLVFKYGKFDAICEMHDRDYEAGMVSRKTADIRFLNRMINASENIKDKIVAYWMFRAVRLFGWLFYAKRIHRR